MSLFDDLLRQTNPAPATGQSSGQSGDNPPATDPLTTANPLIISEATPMVSVVDIVQPKVDIPAGIPMHITESDDSIIIDESDDTPVVTMTPAPIEQSTPAPLVMEVPTEMPIAIESSPLFGTSTTPESIDMPTLSTIVSTESSISDLFETITPTPVAPAVSAANEIVFHDTNEWIHHAIDEASELITIIDIEDAAVLSAEEEHRHKKEHYAELEIADEATHQKHLEERVHAEKMKKYLEREQEKSEVVVVENSKK